MYVYLRRRLAKELMKRGINPTEYVNELVEKHLFGGEEQVPDTSSGADTSMERVAKLLEKMAADIEELKSLLIKVLEEKTAAIPPPREVETAAPPSPPPLEKGESDWSPRRGGMTERQHNYLTDLFERAVEAARRRGVEDPEEAVLDTVAAALLTDVRGVPRDEVNSEMLEEARDQVGRALRGEAEKSEASEVIDAVRSVLRRSGGGRRRGRRGGSGGSSTSPKDLTKLLIERGYLRESDLREMGVRDVDAALDALKEDGAEILVGAERVAVDPDLYAELREKIEKVRTSNNDELKEILGDKLAELLDVLCRSGLCYFDAIENRWRWL